MLNTVWVDCIYNGESAGRKYIMNLGIYFLWSFSYFHYQGVKAEAN